MKPERTEAEQVGFVGFAITARISVAELGGWKPENIKLLFDGIAQVVTAQQREAVRLERERQGGKGEGDG